ncbi:MAG: hypothetical protein ACLR4Z_09485 [Butyricicoccaceae bacterium]
MIIREYGDPAARVMLVQPVGQHELPLIDDEIAQIGHDDRPAVPLSCGTGGKLESGSVAVDGSGGIRG